MRNTPPRSSSSRAPNTDGESNLGKHSHSMPLSGATSASTLQLPMTPWSRRAVTYKASARRLLARHRDEIFLDQAALPGVEIRARGHLVELGGPFERSVLRWQRGGMARCA